MGALIFPLAFFIFHLYSLFVLSQFILASFFPFIHTFELHFLFFFFFFSFFLLLFDQWLTSLWQSARTWGQIPHISWLLQGVHHSSEQQFRVRLTTGVHLRGLWTDKAWTWTVREREALWRWWWTWGSPGHWGPSWHFRVWVSVTVCEQKCFEQFTYKLTGWEIHANGKVWGLWRELCVLYILVLI